MARSTAADWARVRRLLELTVKSARAASDADTRVLVAAHEPLDLGVETLVADWRAPDRNAFADQMQDAGRKQRGIQQAVLERGGGLLMLLDADDWVERSLVAAARAGVGPEGVGGLLERGALVDIRSGRTAELPDPRIFDGPFHRVCGSSGVFRLQAHAADPFRRNPLAHLPVHSRWSDDARACGATLARIESRAAYVVNTGQNNSETIGPHADWKQGVVREVNRLGRLMTDNDAWGWGLTRAEIATVRPAEAA